MSKASYIETNSALIEACKNGSRQAQYQIYKLYSKAMYNVCLRILKETLEAEDVLQEAFIDAFRKIDTFRQESSFGLWLKQIVVNKAISALRKRKLTFVDYEQESYRIETNDFVNYTIEYDEQTVDSQVYQIQKALNMLPEGYRVVLSLYLFEGYDHQEIGSYLGISESTSRTQFMRGKQRLLELLNYQKAN